MKISKELSVNTLSYLKTFGNTQSDMWKLFFMMRNYMGHVGRIILFNFYFLPLNQAVKLPIWIICRNPFREYRKGRIIIDCDKVSTAMIRIGHRQDFYFRRGISMKNEGTIIFKGKAVIGNESAIEVYNGAQLQLGERIGVSSSKFFCTCNTVIGNRCSIGKGCTIMDTDFHRVKKIKGGDMEIQVSKPINIGDENWLGYECLVMKGVSTPDKCIFSARSILRGKYDIPEFSIAGMKQSAEFWADGYYLDPDDNAI